LPLPVKMAAPSSFEMGKASFNAGDYQKAARYFEDCSKNGTKAENRDEALFYISLARALSNNAKKSLRRADEALKRLVAEFPTSPYKGPAELILGLLTQVESLQSDLKEKDAKIKQLSEELQKLKEIDMQRRPSRPPD
jgi:outer membrane protein assembly factor BamD (BamD/ComL family)